MPARAARGLRNLPDIDWCEQVEQQVQIDTTVRALFHMRRDLGVSAPFGRPQREGCGVLVQLRRDGGMFWSGQDIPPLSSAHGPLRKEKVTSPADPYTSS